MSSLPQTPDDELLRRYLVGPIADEEAERLDELTISDDAFASRLRAVENDLVDAYVKGELAGETRDRFESHYLTSPARREKVRFAEALLTHQRTAASAPAPATSGRRRRSMPGIVLRFALAAAAVLVLAAAGYLVVENRRLRTEVTDAQAARAALEERERQLQAHLNAQRSANAETAKELARVQEALAATGRGAAGAPRTSPPILSFVLLPPTRGATDVPTIAIPRARGDVRLQLTLESSDFPAYRIAIKEAATDRIIWRSNILRATAGGDTASLSITLAGRLLEPQIYRAEVSGIPARGDAALVASYSFRVVLQ